MTKAKFSQLGDKDMKKNINRSQLLDMAKNMPPLRHSIPGQEFNIYDSEVIQWLINQPEALNYIWNNIKNSGAVIYDKSTGTWQGVNYEEE